MTRYFKHDTIRNVISHVVWRDLQCPDILQADSMGPLVTLITAAYIIALERHESGVLAHEPSTPEHFIEVYRAVHTFVNSVFTQGSMARARFTEYCSLIISRTTMVLGGEHVENEDNDF